LFTEADDSADLPPPTSLNDLQSASLEQKAMMSLARPDMRIEEAMPTDEMNSYAYGGYVNGYQQDTRSQPQTRPSPMQQQPATMDYMPTLPQQYQPQIPPPPPTYSPSSSATSPSNTGNVNPHSLGQSTPPPVANAPAHMKIRSDYVPRAQARQRSANTVLCPVCNQQILIDEFEQHRRIESLDPQWKEQRAKADARFASTNLGGTDVAANLKRMRAKAEGGGMQDAQILAAAEDDERRKRIRADGDGAQQAVSGNDQQRLGQQLMGKEMNVQDQIRQIHQRYKS